MGHVSPQYHCVYDALYSSVPNAEAGGGLSYPTFTAESWQCLVETGHERVIAQEYDHEDQPIPLPSLHNDWLTLHEQVKREHNCQTRTERIAERHQTAAAKREALQPHPLLPHQPTTAPEGGGQDNQEPLLAPEGDHDNVSLLDDGDVPAELQ